MKACTCSGTRPRYRVVYLAEDGVAETERRLCHRCHRDDHRILAAVHVRTPSHVQDEILEGTRDPYWPEYPNPYIPWSRGAADYYPPESQICSDCETVRQSMLYYNQGELFKGRLCRCDVQHPKIACPGHEVSTGDSRP